MSKVKKGFTSIRYLILIGFLTSYYITRSQNTKLVTKDRTTYYEEYSVLTGDKKIKHGRYIRLSKIFWNEFAIDSSGEYYHDKKNGEWEFFFSRSNNIKQKGCYAMGLRDGFWVFFYPQGVRRRLENVSTTEGVTIQILDATPLVHRKGHYSHGKMIGQWEFFDEHGGIFQKFDYDKNKVIFLKGQDMDEHEFGFIGGEYALYQHLYDFFDFDGLMDKINTKISLQSGKLVFQFKIGTSGNVTEIVCVEKNISNKKIYNRALETVQSLSGLFYPKVEVVTVVSDAKITFDLDVDSKSTFVETKSYISEHVTKGFRFKIELAK
ncbi:MAG: hypothetical protein ACKO96_26885 [Flammeovirgaceae bacterium]